MAKKMTVMGVGKKIAVPVVLYMVITALISYFTSPFFKITDSSYNTLVLVGIIAAVVGFSINMVAAVSMMKGFKDDKLVTGGLYGIFRDPMYIIQIFITLPGLMLLFNSWLCLTTIIAAYVAYRIFIKGEYEYLREKFGGEYKAYTEKVLVKFL